MFSQVDVGVHFVRVELVFSANSVIKRMCCATDSKIEKTG